MKASLVPMLGLVVCWVGGAPAAGPQAVPPAPASDSLKVYGNTPEELRPFHRFVQQPYKQFFVEPLVFTGPGRDKPEPDVQAVKIGIMAPIDRSHESYMGRPMLWATEMALDEANAQGGYKGKPFELVVRNDTGLWGASANEIAFFSYQDSVWAVIGSIDGANTHIAIRVALKTEVPMMNVGDTDPTLVETKIPWVFRNIADDRQMAYTIGYHVLRDRDFKRVAILRANNRYGRFGVGEFRAGSVRLGRPAPIEINFEMAYNQVNPDLTAQLERLRKVNPEAVVLWADAEPGAYIVKKVRQAGFTMPIYASDRVVHPRFLEIAGAAAEGIVAAFPYDPTADIPELKAFQENYRARFGREPTVYAAHAYDGTWMVVQAIRQAGLNRYLIRDALAEMKSYHGITGEIVMDDVYSDRGPVIMATVRNGQWVYNQPRVTSRF
ncbi:MAG: ABC transporter substrate-binding protein [Candidatus Latescibacterota bacterium]